MDDDDKDGDYESMGEEDTNQDSSPPGGTPSSTQSGDEDVFEDCSDNGSEASDTKTTADEVNIVPKRQGVTKDQEDAKMQKGTQKTGQFSPATLRFLASLAICAAGTIGADNKSVVLSHRAAQLIKPTVPRPISYTYKSLQSDLDRKEKLLSVASGLQRLTLEDGIAKLRAMPLTMSEKVEIRKITFGNEAETGVNDEQSPLHKFYRRALRVSRRLALSNAPLKMWRTPMKQVSGRFGTGVLSYFLFLRSLFFLNLVTFLINGLFLAFPQAVYPPQLRHRNHTFNMLQLFTGTGYLSESLMFYGYYTDKNGTCPPPASNISKASQACNTIFDKGDSVPYNIPLAFFCTFSAAAFITCMYLVYSVSKSFGKSFHILRTQGSLAAKVFCAWDFEVTKRKSIKMLSENISTQLKELLSEMMHMEDKRTPRERMQNFVLHLSTWLMCLGSISLGMVIMYYMLEETDLTASVGGPYENIQLLSVSAAISAIDLLLPGFFNLVSWMEIHDSPGVYVYVSIFRNLTLKICIVIMLCYHWLGGIAEQPERRGLQCWESFVGQEVYRLLNMDFIFTLIYTFLGEFVWRLVSKHLLKRHRKPVFDIARNVLELIYGQTLTWLGIVFAPLLPGVQIIKLFVLFYIKKSSLMLNCQASRRPWRASQMKTLFLSILFFPSFLGAVMTVMYAIMTIKPSAGCGPFRNHSTLFDAGELWSIAMEHAHPDVGWITRVYAYLVENRLFLFLAIAVLLMVIYIQIQVIDGQSRIVMFLEKQIENEGLDKKFIMSKFQDLSSLGL